MSALSDAVAAVNASTDAAIARVSGALASQADVDAAVATLGTVKSKLDGLDAAPASSAPPAQSSSTPAS